MVGIVKALLGALLASFKPWTGLILENLALRHQLTVLRRTRPRRMRLCAVDRLLFVWLYRLCPGVLETMVIVRPETVLRWHRDASEPIGAGSRAHDLVDPEYRERCAT